MNTITLKEMPTHYQVEIESNDLVLGSVVLQRDGEPVGILVSMADYQAFQAWHDAQADDPAPSAPTDFAREVAAFERLKPALQEQYVGRAVALYQEQVVAVGDDKMDVLGAVLEKFGSVPCYIEWVEAEAPRRARIPSARIAR